MLAEEKKTNALYAIKVLKKEFIIDNDEVERYGTRAAVWPGRLAHCHLVLARRSAFFWLLLVNAIHSYLAFTPVSRLRLASTL